MSACSDEVFLQELIHRITNPKNEAGDELAVEMFCTLVQNNLSLVKKCPDMIIAKIQSKDALQALRALDLLDDCMSKCGPIFQSRIAKFRFLNELARLVSERFEGLQTPENVKNKIMDCLLLWVMQYPDKVNIKSTYDSLVEKGVKHLPTTSKMNCSTEGSRCDFMTSDEEEKVKKLVQSKDKQDNKKANLLIQYYVNRDAKQREKKGLMNTKLQKIQHLINVLDEVLNRWTIEGREANEEDNFSLIKELKNECIRYKPEMAIIPEIIEDNEEELLAQAIEINDRLLAIIDKCDLIISENSAPANVDKSSSSETATNSDDLLSEFLGEPSRLPTSTSTGITDPLGELTEIFTNSSEQKNNQFKIFNNSELLEPIPLMPDTEAKDELAMQKLVEPRLRELDKISEDLLKANVKNGELIGNFNKESAKISLNDLAKQKPDNRKEENVEKKSPVAAVNLDVLTSFDKLIDEVQTECPEINESQDLLNDCLEMPSEANNLLVNLKESPLEQITLTEKENSENIILSDKQPKEAFKHLSEIHLELTDIQYAKEYQKIGDNQDLEIILYYTLNQPSVDVSVIVISAVNQSCMSVENYQLIASVRKPCKLRTLSPTGINLPGVEPPHLPTCSIKQILLLYNPTKNPVDITFILGYTLGNDPDPIKESIVAKNIPYFS